VVASQNIKDINMERTDLLRLQKTAAYYDSIGQYKRADQIDALIREAALTPEEKSAYGFGAGVLGLLGGATAIGYANRDEINKPKPAPPAIVSPAPKFQQSKFQPIQENIQTSKPAQSQIQVEKPVVEEIDNLNFEEPRQERYEANIIPATKPKLLSIPIKTLETKPTSKTTLKSTVKPIETESVKAPEKTPVVKETRNPIQEKVISKPQLLNKQKMERGDFGATMDLMLNLEGKKTDDPRDRGGRTNFGVTQGTYNRWRDSKNLPRQDVFKIAKDEAMQLYKKNFWGIIGGDKLPQKTAMALMSFALTDGPEDSVRLVQRLLKIPATGYMGPATLARINKLVEKYGDEGFANKVLNRQIVRYQNDEQAHIYGRGWVNRANKVKTRISKL
jgi:hypothetical protein